MAFPRPIVGSSPSDQAFATPVVLVDTAGNPASFTNTPSAAATATDRSLSVTTTAQVAMAANASRKGWKIKNDSDADVWIRFGASAVAAAGSGNARIPAGAYMASEPMPVVETAAMSIIHASTGSKAITITEFA